MGRGGGGSPEELYTLAPHLCISAAVEGELEATGRVLREMLTAD